MSRLEKDIIPSALSSAGPMFEPVPAALLQAEVRSRLDVLTLLRSA